MKAKPKAKRVSNRKPTPRAARASRKNGAKNQPTDNYNAKFCGLAKWSAAAGATDVDIAKALNIGMTTFVEWEKKYPDFKQAIHEGRHEIVPKVVRSLVRRATGFTHKAVKIFYDAKAEKVVQVPYIERYAPDTAAALAILERRGGNEWQPPALRHKIGGDPENLTPVGVLIVPAKAP
ncbi:MAG: hypothetical protein KBF48_13730 [Xanthomonadales bacterium]|nr:hypothetical protein [Xanthomonadales bacterium]